MKIFPFTMVFTIYSLSSSLHLSLLAMFKASQRAYISRSIFSTTFLVATAMVTANTLFPCPIDHTLANDSPLNDVNNDDKKVIKE